MNFRWSGRGPGVSLRARGLRRPQQMSMTAIVRLKSTPYTRNLQRLSNQHDSRPLFHQSPVQFLPATSVAFAASTSSKGGTSWHATSLLSSVQAVAVAAVHARSQSAQSTGVARIPRSDRAAERGIRVSSVSCRRVNPGSFLAVVCPGVRCPLVVPPSQERA